MTVRDEGAQAARILAWGYLLTFMFLTSVARAFYSLQAEGPTDRFELLAAWGSMVLLWHWVRCQGRAALPLDAGLFVMMFSFFAVPLLLWRTQRWRSVAKMALLLAAWIGGWEITFALQAALAWRR